MPLTATEAGMAEQAPAVIDPRELRRVLGSFVTGVTVITTVDAHQQPWGLTANSFTSVSLNPPLILWNQAVTAPSHAVFREAPYFAVNILAEDQIHLSRHFSSGIADKFSGIALRRGLGGVPLLEGCTAHLQCSREALFPGGDHAVLIGRVQHMQGHGRRPLVFGQGRYLMAQPHEYGEAAAAAGGVSPATVQTHAIRLATPLLAEVARDLDCHVALAVWGSHGPTVIRWETAPRQPMTEVLPAGHVCRLLTSATGIVWAAHMPQELVEPMLEAEMTMPLPGGPTQRSQADALLDQARGHGMGRVLASPHHAARYHAPVDAMAVPVRDAAGRMVLSLTAVGPSQQVDATWDGAMARRLRDAALELGRGLRVPGCAPLPAATHHH